MMKNFTERAIEIVRDCAYQDMGLPAADRDRTAEENIIGWRTGSASAGDLETCAAIDHLGLSRAAVVYVERILEG